MCVVRQRFLRRADPSSRGVILMKVLENVVFCLTERTLRQPDPSSIGVLWMPVLVTVVCCQVEVSTSG
jgi:hypothetical protein